MRFKSQFFSLFLSLIFLHSSLSLTLNCRYNEWDWNFSKNVYECQGHHVNLEDTLPYMTNFTGVHMGGGNHTEVQAMRVMHQPTLSIAPTGIGKFFPNLIGLSFINCNLKVITKDHLEEFPEMLQVSYSMNQIEVLPKDLFIHTPKLKLINFQGNLIKHIGVGIFKPLIQIEYVWLEKNVCINSNARAVDMPKLKKNIKKKCRMGGRTDCKKIPTAFTKWNQTEVVNTCEVVHVYRFKALPRHELIKLEREKEERLEKERQDYFENVLKVCEYDSDLVRFLTAMSNLPGQEAQADLTPPPKEQKKAKKSDKKKKKGKGKKKN